MAIQVKKVGNTVVTLDYADCIEDGGKYAIICNSHSYLIQDNNKQRLWKHANAVTEWCAACAGEDKRFSNNKKAGC